MFDRLFRRPGRRARTRLHVELLEDRCVPAVITVTGLGDGVTTDDDQLTLREAILAANTDMPVGDAPAGDAGLDTIQFQPGLSGVITLDPEEGAFTITEDLHILGPGANVIIIDAGHHSRLFNVDDGTAAAISVQISGLSLTEGDSGTDVGGAIRNTENLTLTGDQIINSSSNYNLDFPNPIGGGGGIWNDGTLALSNCSMSSNRATGGGRGGSAAASSATPAPR